jgi:hypothetical protein
MEPSLITVVDPVHGRGPMWGASVLAGGLHSFVERGEGWEQFQLDLLSGPGHLVCWDLRRMLDWPLSDRRVVWEVKALYGGDRNLPELMRTVASGRKGNSEFERYLELDQRVLAHGQALKVAHINLPVLQAVPPELLQDWLLSRAKVIGELFGTAMSSFTPEVSYASDYEGRWPFVRVVREMELGGICVDATRAKELLHGELEPPTATALRSLCSLERNGLVTSLFNPMGGKTGRLRHEGGFNVMSIPHGPARTYLVSRFEGGSIATLDFNAIDYRCIVRSVGGELARAYAGADDFHWRTVELLFPEAGSGVRSNPARRAALKKVTYTHAYGGSTATLQNQTGLSEHVLGDILQRLDVLLQPLSEFRQRLWMQAQEDGCIDVPGGKRVLCNENDSPGKVLGLYAQTYSSWVVEQAVVAVQRLLRDKRTRLVFMVHDELVLDVHPDELGLVEEARKLMERDGNAVKVKKGPSYGEVDG